MWHVSSRSGVATVRTAIYLLLTYLPPLGHNPQTPFADHMDPPLVGRLVPQLANSRIVQLQVSCGR